MPSVQPIESGVKPFTAEFEETTFNAKGESRIASYQTIAVNRDGTRLLKLGLNEGTRQLVDPSGLRITVYGNRKSTTKLTPMPRRLPARQCDGEKPEEAAGERIIFGYRAIGKVQRVSDRSSETWYAADYDCAMLETILTFSTGEKSVLKLRSFTENADARLFDTANLIEGPPSQLDPDEHEECLASPSCRESIEKRDAAYHENRRRNGLSQ